MEKIKDLLTNSNYIVLPDGVIWTNTWPRGVGVGPWRELATTTDTDGYTRIKYKYAVIRLHRVVYTAYLGRLKEGLVINHIDGDKSNNHYTNLEQVTQSKNISFSHHDPKKYLSMKTGYHKLTLAEAGQIRNEYAQVKSYRKLALKYNKSYSTIARIIQHQTFKIAS